jgi:uncharacterized protein (TIGR03437 family)
MIIRLSFLMLLFLVGAVQPASAQQTSIIPITNSASSNGAFVRGASNDGKRIVFESINDYTGENKDGNNEIFVYDVDLRRIVQITRTGSQSGTGSGGGDVLQNNNCPGGCEPPQFTANNSVPAISGDGVHIVFASSSGVLTDAPNVDGNGEIFIATLPRGATAAVIERVTETDGIKDSFDNNTPTINFDGSVIAFVSTRRFFKSRGVQIFTAQNEDSNGQIYVYNVAAKQFTQVTHKRIEEGIDLFTAKGFISNPFLSGDGRTLAFLSGYNFGGAVSNADLNGEVYIYRVGDPINQVAQVTDTSDVADVPEDGGVNVLSRFCKHLSDDGTQLVFESAGGSRPAKTGQRIRDVFLYNLNTGAFTQITTQDVGKRDLSDYNYFPSINGAGTFVTFSSKLNLPVVNDSAGNFNNSREIYRYEIAASTPAAPIFFLATQTRVASAPSDQRQVLFSPFVNDGGDRIAFSNKGDLIAEKFNTTAEVFQAMLRPQIRESGSTAVLTNAASYDTTAIARGSLVAAFGVELANSYGYSGDYNNYPFDLEGVSVTIGDSLSGLAARIISVSPNQVNFVAPSGLTLDDEVAFIINNNGVLSRGVVNVHDAAPGVYAVQGAGTGTADAKCSRPSVDGKDTQYIALPCPIGDEAVLNSLVLIGTGWRFGTNLRVRFRVTLENGELDDIELVPSSTGPYLDENGKESLGLDQITVSLDKDLAARANVETMVLLTNPSDSESVTSQEQVLTSFLGVEEDLIVINAASQESGPIARGSIASARPSNTDNDDEFEEDTLTDQTLTASATNPPTELGGVRVTVANLPARILSVSPEEVRFITPDGVEPADNVEVKLSGPLKVFNTRVSVKHAAPGLFTLTNDGDGSVVARCGLILSNGLVEYSAPPCAVSGANERRLLILTGTGWRFASGVYALFDNVTLIPTYAGPEPGIPGVDRIEIELGGDAGIDVAGKERDIIVQATINGVVVTSQTGAKVAFQERLVDPDEEASPSKVRKVSSGKRTVR